MSKQDDVKKMVDYWKSHIGSMTNEELAECIGNDLAQLEYNPLEVDELVPEIISKLRKATK